MSKYKYNPETKELQVQTPGEALLQGAIDNLSPEVQTIAGDNRRLQIAALNKPLKTAKDYSQFLNDNYNSLDTHQKTLSDLTEPLRTGFEDPASQATIDQLVKFHDHR